jgi:hypothetical protein
MFDLQLKFSKLFLLLSFIVLPLFYYYSSNGVETYSKESGYMLKQFSLGNMGGSSVVCENKFLSDQRLIMSCPTGTIFDYDNVIYGVMSNKLDKLNYCRNEAIDFTAQESGTINCSEQIDDDFMINQIASCSGDKSRCAILFTTDDGKLMLDSEDQAVMD